MDICHGLEAAMRLCSMARWPFAVWSALTEVVHQLGWYDPVSGGPEMAVKRDKPEDAM